MPEARGFVDEAQVHVKAGDGGAGSVSFRREAHVDKGGPDGGNGGTGGDVWLVADRNTASLFAFKDHPFRRATNGTHGMGKNRHGSNGDDIDVLVPEGTTVKTQEGEVIADLVAHGDRFLAGEGGRGGRGNASFQSARRRAPTFAEQGEEGEERWLNLELKLMADVALVGFPNAGKSTLVASVSRAKPKIAAYPFTTLEPHLGVVRFGEHEFVIADIPGLIEGAAHGKGLGHQFLRHIERARVLLVLLNLNPNDGMSPAEQQTALLRELGDYQPELVERPRLVVGTKADDPRAALTTDLEGERGFDGLRVSAVTGENMKPLLGQLAQLVKEARRAEAESHDGTFTVHRPEPEGIAIERNDDASWTVLGRRACRAVAFNDLTNAEALEYAQGRLRRLGVDKALRRAGVKEGDVVHIGGLSFTYEDV